MTNEVEAETIGDWAGHTPRFVEADPAGAADEQLVLVIRQRSAGTITQQVFGLEPYIILRPTVAEDTGLFQVNVEAGGGAEMPNVGEFLEIVAEALQSSATQLKIAETIAAAEAADDE